LVPFRAGTGAGGVRARIGSPAAKPGFAWSYPPAFVVLLEARVHRRQSGPERRPGAAGLRGGRTHSGGDASGAAARGPIHSLRKTPRRSARALPVRVPREAPHLTPPESEAFARS